MEGKLKEYILVFFQVSASAFLALANDWRTLSLWALVMLTASAFLAAWALITMRLSNLSIVPSPKPSAQLVTKGPYRLIRHPMYTSLILFGIPLTLARPDILHILAGAILLLDLLIKSVYEEKLLLEKFPEYGDYRRKTYRMIPCIF